MSEGDSVTVNTGLWATEREIQGKYRVEAGTSGTRER
jgi:hypothetical protein